MPPWFSVFFSVNLSLFQLGCITPSLFCEEPFFQFVLSIPSSSLWSNVLGEFSFWCISPLVSPRLSCWFSTARSPGGAGWSKIPPPLVNGYSNPTFFFYNPVSPLCFYYFCNQTNPGFSSVPFQRIFISLLPCTSVLPIRGP